MHQARLLSIDRQLLAILKNTMISFNGKPSEATEVSISVPRAVIEEVLPVGIDIYTFLSTSQPTLAKRKPSLLPNAGAEAKIARLIAIYKNGKHVVTGRISARNIQDDIVGISCLTEEILLEGACTPAQYNVFENWDLADVARSLCFAKKVIRVKDKTEWQSRLIDSFRCDIREDNYVMLAKNANGQYYNAGYIVLRFYKHEFAGFTKWDRIRWLSDHEEPVYSTMQYRYGDSSSSMGSWSQEYVGSSPDIVGVVTATDTAEIIDVRINLKTDDTESEDPNGKKVGQSPVLFSVELIAHTEQILSTSAVPASTGKMVTGLAADSIKHLEVLQSACAQVGWEFKVSEDTLILKEKLGSDRTNDVVLRNGTNMTIQNLSDKDDDLCNILIAYGEGDGLNRLMVEVTDGQSIKDYGPYPKTEQFEVSTLADLTSKANEYLEKHSQPPSDFVVRAIFPRDGGIAEPDWQVGDVVRVVDPDTGIIVTSRIMELSMSADSNDYNVTLYLGSPKAGLAQQALEGKKPMPVLAPPFSVILKQGSPGLIVAITRESTMRADGAEVYVSTSPGFTPGQDSLMARGKAFKWHLTELTSGERYYIRVRLYDDKENYSSYSPEYSALAGYVKGAEVEDDSITAAKYKEVRNILPWTGECILDVHHPYEFAFEIPDDTLRIQQIKFSATGERFRSYSQVTEAAEIGLSTTADGGEITTSSVAAGVHRHRSEFVTLNTSETNVNISTTVDISSANVDVGLHDPGHSHSVGAIGSTGPGGEDNHTHTVEVHGAAERSGTGISASGGEHTHAAVANSISMAHDHSYTVPIGTTSDGGEHSHQITIPPHTHAINIPPHNHEMVSGIYESSTPNHVFLYFDNGSGYSEFNKVALNIAPDIDTPYILAAGLDVTNKFTGTGYKRIKLVSNRQGRVLFQILAKLDIVAR